MVGMGVDGVWVRVGSGCRPGTGGRCCLVDVLGLGLRDCLCQGLVVWVVAPGVELRWQHSSAIKPRQVCI